MEENKPSFPTEVIELPSKGLLYPESNPLSSGKLEMKYMTAKEEDILSNQSYIQKGTVLDKLLESLITTKEIIVDKSRDWGIHYNLLNMLQENPKIICMVRDVRSVYCSMEKNFRKNPHRESHIQNAPQLVGTTLDKRINIWADGIPVGIAMDRLKDCIQQGIDKKMLFVRYEDLMDNPENEMKRIYEYFELPYYESHDFENVTQLTHENDLIHGIYGDHQLRPKFERKPDDYNEILGFELSNKIKNTYQWFYNYFGYV